MAKIEPFQVPPLEAISMAKLVDEQDYLRDFVLRIFLILPPRKPTPMNERRCDCCERAVPIKEVKEEGTIKTVGPDKVYEHRGIITLFLCKECDEYAKYNYRNKPKVSRELAGFILAILQREGGAQEIFKDWLKEHPDQESALSDILLRAAREWAEEGVTGQGSTQQITQRLHKRWKEVGKDALDHVKRQLVNPAPNGYAFGCLRWVCEDVLRRE